MSTHSLYNRCEMKALFQFELDSCTKMTTITPLPTTRCVLTWLAVYPSDKRASKWRKLASIIICLSILITNVFSLIASIAFFVTFISTDLEGSIYASFQITGLLPLPLAMLISFVLRAKIIAIFEKLTKIYNNRKIKGLFLKIFGLLF